ncbi:acyltransferase [Phycicoccus sp. SLBN-51]|uniref:acyltransferase family protein n=1 Tax=Phycicoccus sp. SLBN-51 TaxID=2768447 RepID=UPI00115045B2|nr:acyltransferase [Phycicoccus sp. SLBN-51]TQJ50992.1 peptidoglycan/LPS O-acetylase OafA/YrhL [Phycicoccus sp. SLBN-51]
MTTTSGQVPRPTPLETGTDLGRRLTALEGLRAVAVLAVVVTHAGFLSGVTGGTVLPGLVARMDFGVAIFFVLSGFLLYLPHARHSVGTGNSPSLRDYAIRRVARIYPAFVLCLVGTLCIVGAARTAPVSSWLATLSLVQVLRPAWHIAPLNHLWSLSTEVAFYLALPLLGRALVAGPARPGRAVLNRQAVRLVALIAATWVFRLLVVNDAIGSLSALSWLPAHLDWFAAGMLLAVLRTGQAQLGWGTGVVSAVREAPVAIRALALVLLWLATTRLAGPYDLTPATTAEDLLKHVLYLVSAAALVAPSALDAVDGTSRALSSRWMVWLGTISYGVFLWHLPMMFAVQGGFGLRLFGGQFWLLLALTLALTVPVAAASWYLVEHPLLRRAHALTRRAPDPVPEPAHTPAAPATPAGPPAPAGGAAGRA